MSHPDWTKYVLHASPHGRYQSDRAAMILPFQICHLGSTIRESDESELLHSYLLTGELQHDFFACTNGIGSWLNHYLEYAKLLAVRAMSLFVTPTSSDQFKIDLKILREGLELWKKFRVIWDSGCITDEAFEILRIKYHPAEIYKQMRHIHGHWYGPIDKRLDKRMRSFVRQMSDKIDHEVEGDPSHYEAYRRLRKTLGRTGTNLRTAREVLYNASAIFIEDIDLLQIGLEDLRNLMTTRPARYSRDYRFERLANGHDVQCADFSLYTRQRLQPEKALFVQYHHLMPAIRVTARFEVPQKSHTVIVPTSFGSVIVLAYGKKDTAANVSSYWRLMFLIQLFDFLRACGMPSVPRDVYLSLLEALYRVQPLGDVNFKTLTKSVHELGESLVDLCAQLNCVFRLEKNEREHLVTTPSGILERQEAAAKFFELAQLHNQRISVFGAALHDLRVRESPVVPDEILAALRE